MAEEPIRRRLAAILAADVVGYSRLMELDEVGTMAALKSLRKTVLEPLVAKHQGRIFKTTGDGVLVEFASAVDAVQCATDLQQGVASANSGRAEDRCIVLRVGINLGDVMVESGDLFGDAVNIAARLEGIADPGGILVSGTTYDYVRNKVKAAFEDLGGQYLKNIAEPVRVFRVSGMSNAITPTYRPSSTKPSIAVLPLVNMSEDVEQEYFSDGITEDIITELSRFRSLFVIARNSSFQYKGKNVDVRRVARDLGVQYILEGSIRKIANRVRITAQLIDTATGSHLWSERFDRALEEIFDVQDQVVRTIAATLEGRLVSSIAEHARRKTTDRLEVYELVLQARNFINTYDTAAAEPLLQRAIGLDPTYAQAYAWLAGVRIINFQHDRNRALLDEALEQAKKAVALDPNDAICHFLLAEAHLLRGEFERAGASYDRALALNPNDAMVMASHAYYLSCIEQREDAFAEFDRTLQCDPFPPSWYWELLAIAQFEARRYEDTIQSIRKMDRASYRNNAWAAASFALLGRRDEARAVTAEVLKANPSFTIGNFMLRMAWKNPADMENLLTGLREAGLPE